MATTTFRHPSMRQLRDQRINYAPRERQIEELDRAEALLLELEPDRDYPLAFVRYRLTGYRIEEPGEPVVLKGVDFLHDLRLFLEGLSAAVNQPAEEVGEPVLSVEQLSTQFQVTNRTVNRWRKQGLAGRRYRINGRSRIGFRLSCVEAFVARYRRQIDRSRRFTKLTESERDEIIRRARRMVARGDGAGQLIAIARRIARKMARSTETVRTTLRQYDQDHPDRPIFPGALPPLDEEIKVQIYSQYRRHVSVDLLAKQHGRTRSSIYRIINEVRAQRILETKLEYVYNECFDDPAQAEEILAPTPEPADGKPPRKARAPKDLPPYLASLYEVPLLAKEQEQHLFRKMNYLKYQAAKLREELNPAQARTQDLDHIEDLQEQALAVKNEIIRANLRLVVSIAKRHVKPNNGFFELVSDGNMSLIRAVEKFDYFRGYKFSTYASWAIMKNFARTIPEENYRRDRYVTGHEELFEAAPDNRSDEHEMESNQKRMESAVRGMLDRLDEREQKIINSRYGLGGADERTLEQLGNELGITKERVRQIQSRAEDKLRRLADEQKLELTLF